MSINPGLMSSETDEWATPQAIYDELERTLGPFDLDPCADDVNHKCERYFTKAANGLATPWTGARVWMNPPYGRGIGQWVAKAASEPLYAVCLLPARTDTAWWHRYCMKAEQIWFVRGRIRFGSAEASAPFPSAVVVFGKPCSLAGPLIKSWKPSHGQTVLELEEAS